MAWSRVTRGAQVERGRLVGRPYWVRCDACVCVCVYVPRVWVLQLDGDTFVTGVLADTLMTTMRVESHETDKGSLGLQR